MKRNKKINNHKNDKNVNSSTSSSLLLSWLPSSTQDYWFYYTNRIDKNYYLQWIDPVLLPYLTTTVSTTSSSSSSSSKKAPTTDIIDKILTSTPRLLIIANFMLSMTYLLHTAIATWFLGTGGGGSNSSNGQQSAATIPQPPSGLVMEWPNNNNVNNNINTSGGAGARERMGGFLVFKLLLISAVVAPDTLDLLILLTWYTWLSCLRSLDHLAYTTTTHLAALGQAPSVGAVQLLFLVLGCDIVAAASCVALFHAAGWGIVLLLTCDCALLGADVLSHILKHFQCALEETHGTTIQRLEARQLELHNAINNNDDNINIETDDSVNDIHQSENRRQRYEQQEQQLEEAPLEQQDDDHNDNLLVEETEGGDEEQLLRQRPATGMTRMEVQQESRRLDRRMERYELIHARRLSILDSTMFGLEMICHLLTVAHFCHIWSLHGVQFTLIDGVLALHLHSAVSTFCKKIAQRRNVHSIARDLQGYFPNATDEELRKASAAGDVCCICLGTMSTGGHVKKVRCGHLYHTHCLREVVERAQSIHAAKCPLCRATLMESNSASSTTANPGNRQRNMPGGNPPVFPPEGGAGTNGVAGGVPIAPAGGERALFRFSTEGILPIWLPVPAFSFEVVRRPPIGAQVPQLGQQPPQQVPLNVPGAVQPTGQDEGLAADTGDVAVNRALDGEIQDPPARPVQEQEPSFLRRLLVLAGAIPMSPEEEARALTQLVDMFPQYDRSDLLRELRDRGSAEAVAEAILMGVFSGVPRGD